MSKETGIPCCGAGTGTAVAGPDPSPAQGSTTAGTCCSSEAPALSRASREPATGKLVLPMVVNPCGAGEGDSPPAAAGGSPGRELPGDRLWPFVEGWVDTPVGLVPRMRTDLDVGDILGRWQMRSGIGRDRYRIAPGLYAVGSPAADSPVLVTANYKMTVDLLRRDLAGLDAWVLVLEAYGINVWCAAGKGSFGTAELVRRVNTTGLEQVVRHRRLILPQLGAPGVSAHEVRKGCAFSVWYGPVRSADIREFLADDLQATPEMRRVTFTTVERLVLTPVELVMTLKPAAWAALALFAFAGFGPGFFSLSAAWHRGWAGLLALAGALFAGAVATPVLLPWLPGRTFSAKGATVGVAVAILGSLGAWADLGWAGFLALVLAVGAGASYVAMNFTGATPFTSPSGVEKEMRRALPWQLGAAALGSLFWLASAF